MTTRANPLHPLAATLLLATGAALHTPAGAETPVPPAVRPAVRLIGPPATRTQPVQLQQPAVEVVRPEELPPREAPPVEPAAPVASPRIIGSAPARARPARSKAQPAVVPPPDAPVADPVAAMDVALAVGESRVIRGLKAFRVAVGTDRILSAAPMDNRQVILFGNAAGETTLQVWDAANRMHSFRVTVKANDAAKLARDVRTLLSDVPQARVSEVGDKVVIDGRGLDDEALARVAALTKQFEKTVVNLTEHQSRSGGWDRMVLMDVKVVEFKNRDHVRDLGVRWSDSIAGPSFGVAGDLHASRTQGGQRFYVAPSTGGGSAAAPTLVDPAAILSPFRSYFGIASAISSRINLLASDGEAVVLSEPQLASRHGGKASMNVGGRVPYVSTTGLGASETKFERYGVRMQVEPWVTNEGLIRAKIHAEVSEPDLALTVNGVPSFRERVVETVFVVRDGETMVLSGMIQRNKSVSVQKVPLLGDAPLIGGAFRSKHEEQHESEVVIFVTPKIVDASHPGVVAAVQATERRSAEYLGPMPTVPTGEARP